MSEANVTLLSPDPFEIVEADGIKHASGNGLTITLLQDGQMYRKRAIKGIGGTPYRVEWLCVELNGVKVYVAPNHIVVTTQELLP